MLTCWAGRMLLINRKIFQCAWNVARKAGNCRVHFDPNCHRFLHITSSRQDVYAIHAQRRQRFVGNDQTDLQGCSGILLHSRNFMIGNDWRSFSRWSEISAYTVPTDFPKSDGTIEWRPAPRCPVRIAGGKQNGWLHAAASTAIYSDVLNEIVIGKNVFDIDSSSKWFMPSEIRDSGYE
jgi:hypothetical protein